MKRLNKGSRVVRGVCRPREEHQLCVHDERLLVFRISPKKSLPQQLRLLGVVTTPSPVVLPPVKEMKNTVGFQSVQVQHNQSASIMVWGHLTHDGFVGLSS